MFVLTLTSLSFWSQKSRPSDSVYGLTPPGYDHNSLVCKVEITDAPYRGVPERWTEQRRDMYQEYYDTFMEMAVKKEIDDNPAIALRQLTLARPYTSRKPERPGDMDTEEEQFIELGYGAVIDNWERRRGRILPSIHLAYVSYSWTFTYLFKTKIFKFVAWILLAYIVCDVYQMSKSLPKFSNLLLALRVYLLT